MKYLLTVFISLWTLQAANADDVDLYQGQSSGVRQNVVFMMDTSRSMSRWEYFNIGPYNSGTTYTVPINGFDPETYYYSGIVNGNGSSETETQILHNRHLHPDALECPSAKSVIESAGRVQGWRFKRWDTEETRWEAPLLATGLPRGTLRTDATWVCKSEEGHHPGGPFIETGYGKDHKYRSNKRGLLGNYDIAIGNGWWYHSRNMFKGNFLNYQIYERGENEDGSSGGTADDRISRMSLVRGAAKEAVAVTQGYRLGLARYDVNSDGGFIDLAVDNVEDVRQSFNDKIDRYFTYGSTPFEESYYEIAQYYRGQNVDFGTDSRSRVQIPGRVVNRLPFSGIISLLDGARSSKTTVFDTPSVGASRDGNTYRSPIESSCQSFNTIVLFTDGEPYSDTAANDKIKTLLNSVEGLSFPAGSGLTKNCAGDGQCADELAYFLNNYDQSPLPGKQTIRTIVIGGFIEDNSGDPQSGDNDDDNADGGYNNDLDGVALLQSIAHHGGGKYYSANNYQDVVNALTETFQSSNDTTGSFVAPAVATNSYSSLEHQDELYYAMFAPANKGNWGGNLKLYKLGANSQVVDAEGKPVIASDGFIDTNARSFWTTTDDPDGANVTIGGAAQHLTNNNNIYTYLADTNGGTNGTLLTDTLTTSSAIKTAMGLDSSTSAQAFSEIIDWGNRFTPGAADISRREMEDPLHSRPVVINYSSYKNSDGEIVNNGVVFSATNSGYLHAFKAGKNNFEELFSFIPKELLPNIPKYATQSVVRKDELYGLDGKISHWIIDKNNNGQVEPDQGDRVILFIGMRRGGNHYYALDVTYPRFNGGQGPKFLWSISDQSPGMSRLGQTWSEMTLAQVPWNGSKEVVLLFGGGYDENEDEALSAAATVQKGNAVYMVNAKTGALMWKSSNANSNLNLSAMKSSIPNDIRLVDFNGDRVTDYFYATDVAGKIWRFDINKDNTTANNFADGDVIFDGNGGASAGRYNRFYTSPSISYFKDEQDQGFLTLSLGSGFRASPLAANTSDEFFIIKDHHVAGKPTDYLTTIPSDLARFDLQTGSKTNATDASKANGWVFSLPHNSEKSITDAITSHGRIIFTTFTPNDNTNSGSCQADIGTSNIYTIYFNGEDGDPTDTKPRTPCQIAGTCPAPPPESPEDKHCPNCFITPPIVLEEGCKKENQDECSCEDSGSVILVGTSSVGEKVNKCGILEKEYWMEQ